MSRSGIHRLLPLLLLACASASWAAPADPAPGVEPTSVDLTKAFATRSPWRLIATHGPGVDDYGGNPAPGALHLCLRKGASGSCVSAPVEKPPAPTGDAPAWEPHYLDTAEPVYPDGPTATPLLLVVTASLHAGDGGQVSTTRLIRYDKTADAFTRIFSKDVGTNNNQEIRFVAEGPLRGAVISAEPTADRPFGFWIVVSRLTPQRTYRQVLRYRSATHYNDGNTLAVIDSEMPNIQRRLGLWKPGAPLPLPTNRACPKPTLKQAELWCE